MFSQKDKRAYAMKDDKFLDEGKYTTISPNVEFIVGEDLALVDLYVVKLYSIRNNQVLRIHEHYQKGLINGSKAYIDEVPAPDGIYRIGLFKKIKVYNGQVDKL